MSTVCGCDSTTIPMNRGEGRGKWETAVLNYKVLPLTAMSCVRYSCINASKHEATPPLTRGRERGRG